MAIADRDIVASWAADARAPVHPRRRRRLAGLARLCRAAARRHQPAAHVARSACALVRRHHPAPAPDPVRRRGRDRRHDRPHLPAPRAPRRALGGAGHRPAPGATSARATAPSALGAFLHHYFENMGFERMLLSVAAHNVRARALLRVARLRRLSARTGTRTSGPDVTREPQFAHRAPPVPARPARAREPVLRHASRKRDWQPGRLQRAERLATRTAGGRTAAAGS